MIRALMILLVLGLPALASDPGILLQPAGFWPLCEAGVFLMDSGFCGGITPGQEPYAVMVRAELQTTTAFEYLISGKDKTGAAKTFQGYIKRFPGAEWSAAVVNCGWLEDAQVTVHELGDLSVRTMQ